MTTDQLGELLRRTFTCSGHRYSYRCRQLVRFLLGRRVAR